MTELASGVSALPKESHALLINQPELVADMTVSRRQERRDWLANRYLSYTWDMDEFMARKDEMVFRELLKSRMDV